MPFLPPQGPPSFPGLLGFPGQQGMPSGQSGQVEASSSPAFIPQQPAVSPFAVNP